MGTCFLYGNGGGGSELNFKVVGGTTQPENPKENTIWVNTNTAITAWVFSAAAPDSPVEGMVWFCTGSTSSAGFNAVKKNTVTLCPIGAKLYAGGAWTEVPAKSFLAGQWVDWITYLYNLGDACEAISGGWDVFNASSGTTRLSTNCIIGDYNNASGAHAIVKTKNKITFPYGNFNTLKITTDVTNQINASAYPNRFGLYTLSGINDGESTGFALQATCAEIGTGKQYSLDISRAKGDFYVAWLNVGKAKVYKIWLE